MRLILAATAVLANMVVGWVLYGVLIDTAANSSLSPSERIVAICTAGVPPIVALVIFTIAARRGSQAGAVVRAGLATLVVILLLLIANTY